MRVEMLSIAAAGGSIIIAVVDAHGLPVVTRGWLLESADESAGSLRVLMHVDGQVVDAVAADRPIAVTTADIVTYSAIQAIGRITSVTSPGPDVLDQATARLGLFKRNVTHAHSDPGGEVERMYPPDLTEVLFTVERYKDQTPGPRPAQGVEVS